MTIKLENIDLLRERAKVSYQDAKEALEKTNNDLVEALIYLEKDNKIRPEKKSCCESKAFLRAKDILRKGNTTRFIIKKEDAAVINLPVTAAVIIGIVATPVVVFGIPVALLTKHKIRFQKQDGGEDLQVNKVMDQMSCAVNNMKTQLCSEAVSLDKKSE